MTISDWTHTEAELQRAEHYIVCAKEIFTRGFFTKTDKKDANDYLSRAYDVLVHYTFNYAVWPLRKVDSNNRSYYEDKKVEALAFGNFPALHVWAKNPDKYAKLYANWPNVVARGNELAALRNAFEAAPLVEKPKSKTAVKREERAAEAKTCQICGRPILAETGLIAHHGYQRPSWAPGNQTASCSGARELPFEVSRDVLGKHINAQKANLVTMQNHLQQVKDEKVGALSFSYGTGKYDHRHKEIRTDVMVRRETFDSSIAFHKANARFRSDMPVSFDSLKAKRIASIENDIRAQKSYITMQQKRYDEWKAVL